MNFYVFVIFFIFLFLFVSLINSWEFGDNEHESITRDALPFLKEEFLNQIVRGVHDEDTGTDALYQANHFDALLLSNLSTTLMKSIILYFH